MCLVKSNKFPRFTIFGKKVYKILVKLPNGKIITQYQNTPVSLGETIHSTAFFPPFMPISTRYRGECVHAYKNKEYAAKLVFNRVGVELDRVLLAEFKIPPLSFYVEGKDNDIGAAKMKFTKMLSK